MTKISLLIVFVVAFSWRTRRCDRQGPPGRRQPVVVFRSRPDELPVAVAQIDQPGAGRGVLQGAADPRWSTPPHRVQQVLVEHGAA